MDILFTDLDNTLIYSKKTYIKKRISVEVYKGEDNSFMSKYSYELLKKLHEKLLIVPVTTRTYMQYERINLSIVPKYVLCANGGQLLKNGASDNEWYLKSLEIIEGSAAERQKAFKILEKDKRRIFECRNIDDLFIFTKCDDIEAVVKDLKSELNLDLVEVLYNKEKLYIMPKKLNKADTVRRFINEYKGKRIFAAGDTEFDKGMIELADIGFAHKKLNIKNTFNEYEGLFSDYYLTKVYEYTKE
jgi:HAD-superfamily hydrolase, subfamily IIB